LGLLCETADDVEIMMPRSFRNTPTFIIGFAQAPDAMPGPRGRQIPRPITPAWKDRALPSFVPME